MKKQNAFTLLFLAVIGLHLLAFSWYYAENESEKDAVKAVVENAYLNGAHNKLNTAEMQKGFHTDFAMFAVKEGELKKVSLADWVAKIEKWKSSPEYKAADAEKTYKFKEVDVVGNVAVVKVELFKESQIIFTDYLSLYKFNDGWKIVSKVFHKHADAQAKK
jgi:hypothetical protein